MKKIIKTSITLCILIIIFTISIVYFIKPKLVLFNNDYNIKILFNNIDGLSKDSKVLINGIEVGKVKSIIIRDKKILVVSSINSKYKIPLRSKITIEPYGNFNNRALFIYPHTDFGPVAENNTIFIGKNPSGQFKRLYKTEYSSLGLQKRLKKYAYKPLLKHAPKAEKKGVDNKLLLLALDNNTKALNSIEGIVKENNKYLYGEKRLANSVNRLIDNMNEHQKQEYKSLINTTNNFAAISGHLRETTDKIDYLADNMKDLSDNMLLSIEKYKNLPQYSTAPLVAKVNVPILKEQTQKDVKKEDSVKVVKLKKKNPKKENFLDKLKKLKDIKTEFGYQLRYMKSDNLLENNVDMEIDPPGRFKYKFGVNKRGDNNTFDLEFANKSNQWTQRIGIMDNSVGVGLDYDFGNNAKISIEVNNLTNKNPKINLSGKYELQNNYHLFLGIEDFYQKQNINIGAGKKF